MADVELVIKIPEEEYEYLKAGHAKEVFYGDAIAKGTPLPEKHGDLIDRNKLLKKEVWGSFGEIGEDAPCVFKASIESASAIIPATKPPHWIERRLQMGLHDWMCSVCKCQCEDTVKICPNCGVDTGGRYEMEEDDGGYWFQQREEQTATKEDDDEIDLPIKHESKPYLMIPLPDGATNGDVIKALFPNYRTDEMSHSVWVGYDNMSFRREWWNAPYKGVAQ